MLEQEKDQPTIIASFTLKSGERALLEQEEEPEIDDLFDKDWIFELRQWTTPTIGLIWCGSVENLRREAG